MPRFAMGEDKHRSRPSRSTRHIIYWEHKPEQCVSVKSQKWKAAAAHGQSTKGDPVKLPPGRYRKLICLLRASDKALHVLNVFPMPVFTLDQENSVCVNYCSKCARGNHHYCRNVF